MKNPFADTVPTTFNPDHYISFELHGSNGRWWVGYSYPDVRTSDPDQVAIAHRCAEGWPALMNYLRMEEVSGPGISYDQMIWCVDCQDSGRLVAGRWEWEGDPREAGAPVEGRGRPSRPVLVKMPKLS